MACWSSREWNDAAVSLLVKLVAILRYERLHKPSIAIDGLETALRGALALSAIFTVTGFAIREVDVVGLKMRDSTSERSSGFVGSREDEGQPKLGQNLEPCIALNFGGFHPSFRLFLEICIHDHDTLADKIQATTSS